VARARSKWRYTGLQRPEFADEPGTGHESVWDYPRPPRCEPDPREVVVRGENLELARTRRSVRVLETASPPTFYLPPSDVALDQLKTLADDSQCEWKGRAVYWSLRDGDGNPIGWSYPDPYPEFAAIADWLSFYPARVECRVDGIVVRPQPGGFYGGWLTPELTGPFKGEAGSDSW
jgi:uncharacterized protein (DUF427 family)